MEIGKVEKTANKRDCHLKGMKKIIIREGQFKRVGFSVRKKEPSEKKDNVEQEDCQGQHQ